LPARSIADEFNFSTRNLSGDSPRRLFFSSTAIVYAPRPASIATRGYTLALKGNSMDPELLHKIAQVLRSAPHQHLGITSNPPRPANSPSTVRLERRDLNSFASALDRARMEWPDTPLTLVGAHGAVGATNIDDPSDALPPGFLQFLDPEMLVSLPVDDPATDS
jgi:hypothetical protein